MLGEAERPILGWRGETEQDTPATSSIQNNELAATLVASTKTPG
jgi:hypothetical protein